MIACLIKRFFYNLKIPLVPFEPFNKLIKDHSKDNIKKVIKALPQKNYLTLMFLISFLL